MQELSNGIASKYEEIIEKIKSFSDEYLNEDYKNICVLATETLFLNYEEQLKKGKSFSWGAGIVHAIGTVNNLFDSKEKPYIKVADLYKEFGVSSSTGSSKSKEVKSLLDISKDNKKWIIGENKDAEASEGTMLKAKEEVALTMNDKIEEDKAIKDETKVPFKFAVHKDYIMAQRIIEYAWRQKNYKNKAKYAKEALEVYEDCADAYIILSKDSSLNNNQKTELLEKAVTAAKNLLRIDDLKNAPAELLRLKIARQLFGAKYSLAIHLWEIGEKEAAIDNALEILEYDEKDELVVRSLVVNWLLIEKRYEQLKSLLEKYEKDNLAAIHYSRVALLYNTNEIRAAESALRRAYKRNPHVIPYILKQKRVSNSLPNLIRFGSEEEAMKYASLGLDVWNDPKMLQWIKEKKKEFDIINFG
ncbi:DUF6398 domain-containing protein [Clostridium beijerinckii]|uniref:DUF6398 domain-containing protein n=1 Tax=Clostridium beijerinckii TaxID=1520 RepID=UPI00098C4ED9|nr:DUF6398 domain-containing protein [Clostridium beijerinckii]MBA8936840.1 hypothetical protein [Clostridium beijerinckii]NRT33603.1 hypothetical protein [Clostridium beijerinckii]NRT46968.1 hypothetical protein [Clostridium beijerinckii]NRU40694.1 hypothetical protein [Clostridium beijerinckii]NRZ19027.1 hypothetical protein [Clostridium beijerinckii]